MTNKLKSECFRISIMEGFDPSFENYQNSKSINQILSHIAFWTFGLIREFMQRRFCRQNLLQKPLQQNILSKYFVFLEIYNKYKVLKPKNPLILSNWTLSTKSQTSDKARSFANQIMLSHLFQLSWVHPRPKHDVKVHGSRISLRLLE